MFTFCVLHTHKTFINTLSFCILTYVEIKNRVNCSSALPYERGVLQGRILYPFPFLVFMNDLCKSSEFFFNFSCMLMTLVHPIHKKNIYELIKRLCIKMIKINHWFVANRLIINQSKTKFMVFHRNNKIVPTVIPSICNNSSYINKVYSFKFFGVMLTEIWKSRNMLLMLLKRCQSSSP